VDVLLLQLAPTNERGEYSLSIAHEYLIRRWKPRAW